MSAAAAPYPVATAMNPRPPTEPPLLLKVAVLVGVVTLLGGLGGAIYLRLLRSESDSPWGAVAVVQLTNVPPNAALTVTATWSEGEESRTEEALAGTDDGIWSFHVAPVQQALTLTIWRTTAEARSVWIQRSVVFDRRERVVVQLPAD